MRLLGCVLDRVVSNTGAPQGTVLVTLSTTDFSCRSESCHLQKFSDDSALVGSIRGEEEPEYRSVVGDLVSWCERNNLQLNITKMKGLVMDRKKIESLVTPVSIQGVNADTVGVYIDSKLVWGENCDALCKNDPRRLRSFNICQTVMRMFYDSVVSSDIVFAVVCWGSRLRAADAKRLNKLICKAGDVVRVKLDSLETVMGRRMLKKLRRNLDNSAHPLNLLLDRCRSSRSARLTPP